MNTQVQSQAQAQAWQPLRPAQPGTPNGTTPPGVRPDETYWINDTYQVCVRDVEIPGWPGGGVTWLSIKRRDRTEARDWRDFQRIKNQLCGETREGVELYPDERRLVDTSNQYHMFVLDEGMHLPFGFGERRVVDHDGYSELTGTGQRGFHPDDRPEDAITDEEADAEVKAVTGMSVREITGREAGGGDG